MSGSRINMVDNTIPFDMVRDRMIGEISPAAAQRAIDSIEMDEFRSLIVECKDAGRDYEQVLILMKSYNFTDRYYKVVAEVYGVIM